MERVHTPYQEAVSYLYSLQKYGIKFGLSKTVNLLAAMGNPHKGQDYIHVGGTNGKGSVAAMLAAILTEAGLNVGFYSSPHLVRFTERFKINNQEIEPEKTVALVEEMKRVVTPEEPPTFFEATTVMALAYFAREKTDVAIMEVGMGGRLDATNVITPLVTAITNISLEHQAYLGSHLLDIAREKAGIIKEGVDVITGVHQRAVIELIESVCHKRKAPLWRVGKDFRYRMKGGLFHYYGMTHRVHGLELGLKGQFQGRNAALVLAVLERLGEMGFRISSDDIRAGLKHVVWPGRMHVLARDPTIILDGAHNPGAVKTLARSLEADFKFRRLILVIGVMADKDIAGILREIVPLSDYVIYTRPVYSRAASPDILAAKAKGFGKPGRVVPVLTEALEEARKMAHKEDLVVVCGSLFTVGEALTHFDPEKNRPDGF